MGVGVGDGWNTTVKSVTVKTLSFKANKGNKSTWSRGIRRSASFTFLKREIFNVLFRYGN